MHSVLRLSRACNALPRTSLHGRCAAFAPTRCYSSQPAASAAGSGEQVFDVASDEHFANEVLAAPDPVIVDFHATWCRPCKILAPKLEKAVKDTGGAVRLAKVDGDVLPDLTGRHWVNAFPTVLTFHKGAVVDKMVGVQPDAYIKDFVERAAKKKGTNAEYRFSYAKAPDA